MSMRFRVCALLEGALEQRGISSEAVLRQAGLPRGFFQQEKLLVTTEELFALWRTVGSHSPDPSIGLQLGAEMSVERYDPAAIAALCSRTYRDALTRISRYKKISCPEEVRVTSSPEEVSVEFTFLLGRAAEPTTLVDLCLAWIWAIGRRGTGFPLNPLRLEVTRPAADTPILEQHFGCPIHYNTGHNRLILAAHDVERAFVTHNAALFEMLGPQLEAELRIRESNLGDQVKGVLKALLAGHRPKLPEVSAQLGMTPRTLQRRLTETGLTFQSLLEEARRDLARHYLTHSGLELNETAYLLGYDDANSFFRAFHNWEGTTPGQWRNAHAPAHN
ncbi:MAG: AraC family transcriptional regulator ligand-binding domain-containing protein [Candidatus Eremiobacteraeota bacterium]|nr:AraC family transcriptional regulator ligand-binding domain-containing protein [Candidatus Eremiobacteraeota bacterium]